MVAGRTTVLPIEIPLGNQEGAYDVAIAAGVPGKIPWPHAIRSQRGMKAQLAERTIQVIVLNPRPPREGAGGEQRLAVVQEIDPANPKWWTKFASLPQLARLPRLLKGPMGNGNVRSWQHPLGQLAQLAPSANSSDVSWEAYTLPIHRPGEPHVLEVDYPSDVPQTLGISILEPNAARAVVPIGLDSGVEQSEDATGLRHRGPGSVTGWSSGRGRTGRWCSSPIAAIGPRPLMERSASWPDGSICRGRFRKTGRGRPASSPRTWIGLCFPRISWPARPWCRRAT
jgi:hypothetical protein